MKERRKKKRNKEEKERVFWRLDPRERLDCVRANWAADIRINADTHTLHAENSVLSYRRSHKREKRGGEKRTIDASARLIVKPSRNFSGCFKSMNDKNLIGGYKNKQKMLKKIVSSAKKIIIFLNKNVYLSRTGRPVHAYVNTEYIYGRGHLRSMTSNGWCHVAAELHGWFHRHLHFPCLSLLLHLIAIFFNFSTTPLHTFWLKTFDVVHVKKVT